MEIRKRMFVLGAQRKIFTGDARSQSLRQGTACCQRGNPGGSPALHKIPGQSTKSARNMRRKGLTKRANTREGDHR